MKNRKGFTLIELLSIIVIIGLISGITITVVLSTISKAKERSRKLTRDNVAGQAVEYINEGFSNTGWTTEKNGGEYKCVTVQDLIDVGYFKQDIINESNGVSSDSIVRVTRDSITKVILSKEIDNGIMCNQNDASNSTITCSYDEQYSGPKDVTISFSGPNYKKELDLTGIVYSDLKPTLTAELNNYFTTEENIETITLKAKQNGRIVAKTTFNGNQMSSLLCVIRGIDNNGPLISLTSEEDYINSDKTVTINVLVEDEGGLDGNKTINKNNILVYVGSSEQSQRRVISVEYLQDISTNDQAYYKIKLKGITGDGKLKLRFIQGTFEDNNGNSNEETDLDTNILVDNIKPKIRVVDKDNVTCYTGVEGSSWNCTSWHNAGDGYKVTTTIVDEGEYNSPIVGGYFDNNSDFTTFNTDITHSDFPIESQAEVNGKYIHVMDAAGNINGFGPYAVKIDSINPTVEAKVLSDGKTISCEITDNQSKVKYYKICKSGSCNSTSYIEISATNSTTQTKITDPNNDAGIWYCYGKDAVGNTSSDNATISTQAVSISASFVAKKVVSGTESEYTSGTWTNQTVRLKATINVSGTTAYYVINNSSDNPTSGWNTYSQMVTQDLSDNINKTYYLHVKYSDNGTTKYITKSIVVKIDKSAPKCTIDIKVNNSTDGVTATIKCTDTGGSGCTSTTTNTYSNQTSDFSQMIYDNAGNSEKCKVTVTKTSKKQYCQESNYNERCMTKNNSSNSPTDTKLTGRVTCNSGYSGKTITTNVFRYYVRQTREQWHEKIGKTNGVYNLNKYSNKLCYSTLKPTEWKTVKHKDENNKWFWYAIGPFKSSGSIDSPLQRGIKGLVICGDAPASTDYKNLGAANNQSNPSGYFEDRYKKVNDDDYPTSYSSNNRVQHRGYSCQYENTVSNFDCADSMPSGVLIIPTENNGYYVEYTDPTPQPETGPTNWTGDKWFKCVATYTGTK